MVADGAIPVKPGAAASGENGSFCPVFFRRPEL